MPTIINAIFITNSLFSSNPVYETYSFNFEKTWYGGRHTRARLESSGYIHLENNKYSKYHWYRLFFKLNFDEIKSHNKITYHFEDGLLGMRVLKDYKFGIINTADNRVDGSD